VNCRRILIKVLEGWDVCLSGSDVNKTKFFKDQLQDQNNKTKTKTAAYKTKTKTKTTGSKQRHLEDLTFK